MAKTYQSFSRRLSLVKQRIGSQQQDYLQHKWYKKGIMDKNGFWSEPYIGAPGFFRG